MLISPIFASFLVSRMHFRKSPSGIISYCVFSSSLSATLHFLPYDLLELVMHWQNVGKKCKNWRVAMGNPVFPYYLRGGEKHEIGGGR
jgi:hypothetical protein